MASVDYVEQLERLVDDEVGVLFLERGKVPKAPGATHACAAGILARAHVGLGVAHEPGFLRTRAKQLERLVCHGRVGLGGDALDTTDGMGNEICEPELTQGLGFGLNLIAHDGHLDAAFLETGEQLHDAGVRASRVVAVFLVMAVEIVEDTLELGGARHESVLGEKLDEHDGPVPCGLTHLIKRDEREVRAFERVIDTRLQIFERIEQSAVHIEKYCVHNASFLHLPKILPQGCDIFFRALCAVGKSRYTGSMSEESQLILASGSPRRKELLERTGRTFRVIVSDADEVLAASTKPANVAMANARAKALAVAALVSSGATVIGADTIVVLDGRIFGKPADDDDARRMLRELSGKTHEVITGVCIVRNGSCETFAETTGVCFRNLSAREIEAYIATGEPLDKAGAYGIQGAAGAFVDHIEGDYDNVVGLPVARLERTLDLEGGNEVDDGQDGKRQGIE